MIIKARVESGNQRSASVCLCVSVLNECIVHSRNLLAFRKLNPPFLFATVLYADLLSVTLNIVFAQVYFPFIRNSSLELLITVSYESSIT